MDPFAVGLAIEVAVGLLADRAVDRLRGWVAADGRRRDLAAALRTELIRTCEGSLRPEDGHFVAKALLQWLRQPAVIAALAQPTSEPLLEHREGLRSSWRAGSYEHPRQLGETEVDSAARALHLLAVTGALPEDLQLRLHQRINQELRARIEELATRRHLKEEIDDLIQAVIAAHDSTSQQLVDSRTAILEALDSATEQLVIVEDSDDPFAPDPDWRIPPVFHDDGGASELLRQKPPAPGSRDADLSFVTRLMNESAGGTILVAGNAFQGKTTLLAALARRFGSTSTQPVALMNIRGEGYLPTRPLEVLNTRFIELLGRQIGLARGADRLIEQYRILRDRVVQEFRQLVVIVDALDEAPQPLLLATALAQPPPPGCWVIVSCRPSAPLLPSHYLLRRTVTHRLDLPEIPEATARKDAAHAWADGVASDRDPTTHAVFAALAAARHPLASAELADLLDRPLSTVNRILEDSQHRPWFSEADRYGRRRLGHDYLGDALASRLGPQAMLRADEQLKIWARRYSDAGWPRETPRYLLEHLPTRPDPLQPRVEDGSDMTEDIAEKLVGLSEAAVSPYALTSIERARLYLDEAWQRRRIQTLGERRTLYQIGLTTSEDLTKEHLAGTDRLGPLIETVLCTDRWRDRTREAALGLAVSLNGGDLERAIRLARDAAATTQDPAEILAVVRHPITPEHIREQLLAEAHELNPSWSRDMLMSHIGATMAAIGNYDGAMEIARQLKATHRQHVLSALAAAGPDMFPKVENLTSDLWPHDRVAVLLALAAAGHDTAISEALRIARGANPNQAPWLLLSVGRSLAEAGQFDEARLVLSELSEAPRRRLLSALAESGDSAAFSEVIQQAELRSFDRRDILEGVMRALGWRGEVTRARELADSFSGTNRQQLLVELGVTLARRGDVEEARRIAADLGSYFGRPVLDALVRSLAADGRSEDARLLYDELKGDDRYARIARVASALAQIGRAEESRSLREMLGPEQRFRVLVEIGESGELGALDEAMVMLNVLHDEPGSWILGSLGQALAENGRLKDARAVARRLSSTDRANIDVKVGLALARLGMLDEALQTLDEADEAFPRLKEELLREVVCGFASSGQLGTADRIIHRNGARARSRLMSAMARRLAKTGAIADAMRIAAECPLSDRCWLLVSFVNSGFPSLSQEAVALSDKLEPYQQAQVLCRLPYVPGALDRAHQIASSREEGGDWLLGSVASAMVLEGRLDDARSIAATLAERERTSVLVDIGEALAEASRHEEAIDLANTLGDGRGLVLRSCAENGYDQAWDLLVEDAINPRDYPEEGWYRVVEAGRRLRGVKGKGAARARARAELYCVEELNGSRH